MATASLTLGILSLLSITTVIYAAYAYFFACMSMILAILSKGGSSRMPKKAKGGFTISLVSLALVTFLLIAGFFILVNLFGLETVLDPEALLEAVSEFMGQLTEELPVGGNIL